MARSRASAQRSRGSVAVPLASVLSAELSTAALPASAVLVVADVPAGPAAGLPDDDTAQAIPPPARKPARVTPTPQRSIRCLRDGPEGEGEPTVPGVPAGVPYMLFIPVRVRPGSWTCPGSR